MWYNLKILEGRTSWIYCLVLEVESFGGLSLFDEHPMLINVLLIFEVRGGFFLCACVFVFNA